VFFVRDTGPGLPPEELATLFGPRWRSKHAGYRGTGLGFAIARGIVDAHGGRIWADSTPGAGLSVDFSLALARH
jgi:signal transduction histidine kinase